MSPNSHVCYGMIKTNITTTTKRAMLNIMSTSKSDIWSIATTFNTEFPNKWIRDEQELSLNAEKTHIAFYFSETRTRSLVNNLQLRYTDQETTRKQKGQMNVSFPQKQTSLKFEAKPNTFLVWKYVWKYRHEMVSILCINSSLPSAAYMRKWIGSALVQIMACRLFGAKPLPEPMLTYCKLDHGEQTLVKFESKYKPFHPWKCISKCRLRNSNHFVQGEMS